MEPTEAEQAVERRADYRFFRGLTRFSSRLAISGLVFTAWRLAWYRDPLSDTTVFLLSTTVLALFLSIFAALVAYTLFRRGGGTIEKTPPPPGVGPGA